MKWKCWMVAVWVIGIGAAGFGVPTLAVNAQETLRYSCSNQVYKAFDTERIAAFSQETGISVELFTASSGSAIYRLMNDMSDVASTARELYRRQLEDGYVQIPFCKDPIAVITRSDCPVKGLSEAQLQQIFSREITNWKAVGGPDQPITVVVPDADTAANKNFRRQVMKNKEIGYDLMAFNSTMVIDVIRNMPCGAISFISQGAVMKDKDIQSLQINGLPPSDLAYPYHQVFYFVTKGEPEGAARQFVDFAFSEKGMAIIKDRGMVPLAK